MWGVTIYGRSTMSDHALRRAVAEHRLVRVARGVYTEPGNERSLLALCGAVCRQDERAVITGRAAAALSWWPELPVPTIGATRTSGVTPRAGFEWSARRIPGDHVVAASGIRFTDPAWTILDLLPSLGGLAIDEGLRRRAVSLPELHATLADMPHRPGNPERASLLADSRDQPWAESERKFHRILRELRPAWPYRTNFMVQLPSGPAFLDAALPTLKLGFEIDGFAYHSTRSAFEHDRGRDLDFALIGWAVHRFTASMVDREPDHVRWTVATIARAREKFILKATRGRLKSP